jgi:hypothetical protein
MTGASRWRVEDRGARRAPRGMKGTGIEKEKEETGLKGLALPHHKA